MSNGEVTTDNPQIQDSLPSNVPKMAQYMKFIGILQIIGGALYCITIIGALIGVPLIYMGIRMREAAEGFKKYITTDARQDLDYAIDRQTRFFFIQFVLAIIALAFLGIYLIVLIGLLASGALF